MTTPTPTPGHPWICQDWGLVLSCLAGASALQHPQGDPAASRAKIPSCPGPFGLLRHRGIPGTDTRPRAPPFGNGQPTEDVCQGGESSVLAALRPGTSRSFQELRQQLQGCFNLIPHPEHDPEQSPRLLSHSLLLPWPQNCSCQEPFSQQKMQQQRVASSSQASSSSSSSSRSKQEPPV